jgi:thioredoxin-related protein
MPSMLLCTFGNKKYYMQLKSLSIFVVATLIIGSVVAQTPVPTASTVLSAAYKKAGDENKSILLIFHASWCGWCKKWMLPCKIPLANPSLINIL